MAFYIFTHIFSIFKEECAPQALLFLNVDRGINNEISPHFRIDSISDVFENPSMLCLNRNLGVLIVF
jgi:hypothetical protein